MEEISNVGTVSDALVAKNCGFCRATLDRYNKLKEMFNLLGKRCQDKDVISVQRQVEGKQVENRTHDSETSIQSRNKEKIIDTATVTRKQNHNGAPDENYDHKVVEMPVPVYLAGAVIGRGGGTIRHIEKMSAANVTMNRDMTLGTNSRQVIISGGRESVENARLIINECLRVQRELDETYEKLDSNFVATVQINVTAAAGRFLVRDDVVDKIGKVSGAKINIGKVDRNTDVRKLMITGHHDRVKRAQFMIQQCITEVEANSRNNLQLETFLS